MAHGKPDPAGSGLSSGGAGDAPEQPLQALRGAGARRGSPRVRARRALMSASAGPFAEDLASDTESGSSEEDASGSDEDVAAWISWFVSLRGNEFFCEVDEDFIQDDFNLSGLSSQVQGPRPHRVSLPAPACAGLRWVQDLRGNPFRAPGACRHLDSRRVAGAATAAFKHLPWQRSDVRKRRCAQDSCRPYAWLALGRLAASSALLQLHLCRHTA